MTQLIKREQLEEIMLSFVFELYDENDIAFINQVYSNYEKRKLIFSFIETEIYFKEFIITYCRQNCNLIVDRVNFTNPKTKNTFIYNFKENENPIEELYEENNMNQPLVNNGDGPNKKENNRNIYYSIIFGGIVTALIFLLFFFV